MATGAAVEQQGADKAGNTRHHQLGDVREDIARQQQVDPHQGDAGGGKQLCKAFFVAWAEQASVPVRQRRSGRGRCRKIRPFVISD